MNSMGTIQSTILMADAILLDRNYYVDQDILNTYKLKENSQVFRTDAHPTHDQLLGYFDNDSIGGSALVTAGILVGLKRDVSFHSVMGKASESDSKFDPIFKNPRFHKFIDQSLEGKTGECSVLITDGCRTLITDLGVANKLNSTELPERFKVGKLLKTDFLYITGYGFYTAPDKLSEILNNALNKGAKIAYNISGDNLDQHVEQRSKALHHSDIVFGNLEEWTTHFQITNEIQKGLSETERLESIKEIIKLISEKRNEDISKKVIKSNPIYFITVGELGSFCVYNDNTVYGKCGSYEIDRITGKYLLVTEEISDSEDIDAGCDNNSVTKLVTNNAGDSFVAYALDFALNQEFESFSITSKQLEHINNQVYTFLISSRRDIFYKEVNNDLPKHEPLVKKVKSSSDNEEKSDCMHICKLSTKSLSRYLTNLPFNFRSSFPKIYYPCGVLQKRNIHRYTLFLNKNTITSSKFSLLKKYYSTIPDFFTIPDLKTDPALAERVILDMVKEHMDMLIHELKLQANDPENDHAEADKLRCEEISLGIEHLSIDSTMDELHFDSMDLADLLYTIEQRFDITFEDSALDTITSIKSLISTLLACE